MRRLLRHPLLRPVREVALGAAILGSTLGGLFGLLFLLDKHPWAAVAVIFLFVSWMLGKVFSE